VPDFDGRRRLLDTDLGDANTHVVNSGRVVRRTMLSLTAAAGCSQELIHVPNRHRHPDAFVNRPDPLATEDRLRRLP